MVKLDPDGVLRRTPLFIQLEAPEGLLPSLELQTAAVLLGAQVEPAWDPRSCFRRWGPRRGLRGHPAWLALDGPREAEAEADVSLLPE